MNVKTIEIKTRTTQDCGCLSFFESCKDIDFEIKRIYYIYDVPKAATRGYHSHKHLWQLLFCVTGCVEIEVDDGYKSEIILLDQPKRGLVVGPGIWRTMKFVNENSVLCVAASDYYDEDDYIRNYDEFKQLVKQEYWKE